MRIRLLGGSLDYSVSFQQPHTRRGLWGKGGVISQNTEDRNGRRFSPPLSGVINVQRDPEVLKTASMCSPKWPYPEPSHRQSSHDDGSTLGTTGKTTGTDTEKSHLPAHVATDAHSQFLNLQLDPNFKSQVVRNISRMPPGDSKLNLQKQDTPSRDSSLQRAV